MTELNDLKQIAGVKLVQLKTFNDSRGRFREIFRKEWFPQSQWLAIQSNHSESKKGVLRGLHYHHRQADYWYVIRGRIRAGLVDLRTASETFLASATIELSHINPQGLYIPTGVAHGFVTLEDTNLLYIVDNYYDGEDEYGVAWNDPKLGIVWGVEQPIISSRDLENPLLSTIPVSDLP
jgi:dTDP-4-dehydrorhamnose 3,5-epimerase